MALKDRICSTLGNIKTNYGCAVPQTGYKGRICTAINATYTALGCGGITPPTKLPDGSLCSTGSDCLSEYCNAGVCETP
jgi:hypothetical protein